MHTAGAGLAACAHMLQRVTVVLTARTAGAREEPGSDPHLVAARSQDHAGCIAVGDGGLEGLLEV